MKKTEKLLSTLLMIVMFITSVGLLYASIYASGGGTQSTFGSVVFEKETGIRYNSITKEFEVFNEAGVSWIGSGRYISVEGVVAPSGTATNPNVATYAQADSNQTYNIMRDIAYSGTISGDNIYNTSFDTNKITLGSIGILDGRGFTLKNFEVKTITLEGKAIGTALVATNSGTIRNLNMSNVNFGNSTTGDAVSLICGVNKGTIDRCIVYGTDLNNTYQSNQYTGLYGIAAVTSGKILNSVNNANLVNERSGAMSAGIASVMANASLLNNINNGNITSTDRASGIAIDFYGISFTVRGNTNNGNLSALLSVSGIVDGGIELEFLNAKDNTNNGDLDCQLETHQLYYGAQSDEEVIVPKPLPDYGIRYKPSLNNGGGGFEIINADGMSWVGSKAYFSADGEKAADGTTGAMEASSDSYYEVKLGIEEIDYNLRSQGDESYKFNEIFYGTTSTLVAEIGLNGIFEGNNCTLKNFPLRRTSTSASYYSTLFFSISGVFKNTHLEINTSISATSASHLAGALAARINGTVSNVTVSGSMTFAASTGTLGGLSAENSGTISGVNVNLTLKGAATVGGICGNSGGTIKDSNFSGSILAEGSLPNVAGGIVGYNSGTIQGATFSGNIIGEGTLLNLAGGIAGENIDTYSYYIDCTVSGVISASYCGTMLGLYTFSYSAGIDIYYSNFNASDALLKDLQGNVVAGGYFGLIFGEDPIIVGPGGEIGPG